MELDRRLFDGKLQSAVVYPEFFPMDSTQKVINLGCGVGPQIVVYKGKFKEMVCVDISSDRLAQLDVFMSEHGISNISTRCARVEDTHLNHGSFDRALCIDIIEHLSEPSALLQEIYRLLKPGGKVLVTIPVMHDRWVRTFRYMRKVFTGKSIGELPIGHPDRHNSDFSRRKWIQIFQDSPLVLRSIRATTLFPPLHLVGIPRFWFRTRWIHALDQVFCGIPGLRRLGQSWMCILDKTPFPHAESTCHCSHV